jgi:hypothetical protein
MYLKTPIPANRNIDIANPLKTGRYSVKAPTRLILAHLIIKPRIMKMIDKTKASNPAIIAR